MTTTSTIVVQARCSNSDRFTLRLLPVDARHLWLDLGVALGEIPPLPSTDEDEGE